MTAPASRVPAEKRTRIAQLLQQRHTVGDTARAVGASKRTVAAIRDQLGLPNLQHQPRPTTSLADTFHTHTRPTEDGHLDWTGPRTRTGLPVFTHQGTLRSARRVAYTLHTGRQPIGRVAPGCDHHDCVQPAHIDDTPTRQHHRNTLRAVLGMPPPPANCPGGHDQTEHGRLDPHGVHYCAACNHQRTKGTPK